MAKPCMASPYRLAWQVLTVYMDGKALPCAWQVLTVYMASCCHHTHGKAKLLPSCTRQGLAMGMANIYYDDYSYYSYYYYYYYYSYY